MATGFILYHLNPKKKKKQKKVKQEKEKWKQQSCFLPLPELSLQKQDRRPAHTSWGNFDLLKGKFAMAQHHERT